MSDYAGKLIQKPWGLEWCALDNGAAAVWVLHIAKKRKTSLHCHPNKRTILIVISGSVKYRCTAGQLSTPEEAVIGPLGAVEIPKGMYHQTEAVSDMDNYPSAEDGAWLLEIEEPPDKNDLVRIQDEYGREGQPYETDAVPYTGERLTFSGKPEVVHYMRRTFTVAETGNFPIGNGLFLTVAKDTEQIKLSHYVADFIADLGIKHVFSVAGGGSMHLVDSIGNNRRLKYVACHHEQAAAMAAESYARLNGIGCCLVTTGPGGTNAVTGVSCAWIDSIPVLFLSGQVTRDTLLDGTGVRQFGVQESDIVSLVKPITKYAVTIKDEKDIRYELEKAVYIARSGRQGPVWLDIPLCIQSKQIDPQLLHRYFPDSLLEFEGPGVVVSPSVFTEITKDRKPVNIKRTLSMLSDSKRPVLIVGNGVRLAGAETQIRELVDALSIPVISSWTAADMVADSPYHIGHMGIFGDRASNFTVQNADLLLVIGCRLSVPMIGYNFAKFAPNAKIIMVDIDEKEIKKPSLHVDLAIVADAKEFIGALLSKFTHESINNYGWLVKNGIMVNYVLTWLQRCQAWKVKYPVVLPEYADQKDGVNSFAFIDKLCEKLPDDAIIVLDQGTAFTCTFQAAKMKHGQRWLAGSGHAAMGWGLPAAVGAAFASGKKVICIVGDGDLQFNIQELATIAHNKLPIVIFVLNNGGYLTIKHMQSNHFNRYVGSEKGSGVSFPYLRPLAGAYLIPHILIKSHRVLELDLDSLLTNDWKGPIICEIMMPPDQPLIPRVSSKKMPDGSIISSSIEDMWPFLPRDEFNANMGA